MKTVSAEYTAGFGWQYVIYVDGALVGRYGSFDTEQAALRAGRASWWITGEQPPSFA